MVREKNICAGDNIKGNSSPLLMRLKMSLSVNTPERYKAKDLSSSHRMMPGDSYNKA
jgi:hypothetical protein